MTIHFIGQKRTAPGGSESVALGDDELCRLNRDEFWEEFIRKEVKRPAMDLENDYLELALQVYGGNCFGI